MLQFNRYHLPGEPKELLNEFFALISHFEIFRDYDFLIRKARTLLERFPNSERLLCANARLYLWARSTRSTAAPSDILVHSLRQRCAQPLSFFAQQELVGVFGIQGLQQIGVPTENLATAIRITTWNYGEERQKQRVPRLGTNPLHHKKPPLHFIPATSGFFSTIENILLMAYIADSNGSRLVLAPEKYWWRYDMAFTAIFGDLFELADDSITTKVKWITRDSAAQWLQSAGDSVQVGFFAAKHSYYLEVHAALVSYMKTTGKRPKSAADTALLFLRGGDKFSQETIAFPYRLIEATIAKLDSQCGRVQVLSDDWRIAEALTTDNPQLLNITQETSLGHQLGMDRSVDDVWKIIENFISVCSAEVSAGCPSSNLINAANVYRRAMGHRIAVTELFPIEAYLLL